MAISDKTRKALWAKSGNRCSICKVELVQNEKHAGVNLIIGEECHIVSAKEKGPRGNVKEDLNDFDSFENLLLLCANDHKKIDEFTDIYTVEKLKSIKKLHENWVKTTLDRDVTAFSNDELNIKSLPRIITGQQLVNLIASAHIFDFSNDELKTKEEAELIGQLFQQLTDYGDALDLMEIKERIALAVELNSNIEELENAGFLLFGLKRSVRLHKDKVDVGIYNIASLVAVKNESPSIVGEFLIAQMAKKYSFI